MLAIADYASDTGVAFPSQQTIAEKARCDESTVRRQIRDAKERGEVEVWEWVHKTSKKRLNCYRLVVGELAVYRGVRPEEIVEKATVLRVRVPTATRREVFARDNWTCQECGAKTNLTLDHVIPVSKGGGSGPENLQVLCGVCNRRKWDTVQDDRPGDLPGHDRAPASGRDRVPAPAPKKEPSVGTVNPSARQSRERDIVFDAIAVAVGIDLDSLTPTLGRGVGQAKSEIRQAHPDLEPDQLVEEIRKRAKRYRDLHPTWDLTADALRKWWATLGTKAEAKRDLKPRPGESGGEWLERIRGRGLGLSQVKAKLRSEWGYDEDEIGALLDLVGEHEEPLDDAA